MRRRQSVHPYGQASSPERKKSSSNLGSAFGRFGRRESHQNLDSQLSPPSTSGRPSTGPSQSPRASDSGPPPIQEHQSSEGPNGISSETNGETSAGLVNGAETASTSQLPELKPLPAMTSFEVRYYSLRRDAYADCEFLAFKGCGWLFCAYCEI